MYSTCSLYQVSQTNKRENPVFSFLAFRENFIPRKLPPIRYNWTIYWYQGIWNYMMVFSSTVDSAF